MSKQPSLAPTASAIDPCPTIPELEAYPGPSHHPITPKIFQQTAGISMCSTYFIKYLTDKMNFFKPKRI